MKLGDLIFRLRMDQQIDIRDENDEVVYEGGDVGGYILSPLNTERLGRMSIIDVDARADDAVLRVKIRRGA